MAGVLEKLMVQVLADSSKAKKEIGGFRDFVEGAMEKIQGAGALAAGGVVAGFAEAMGQEAETDLLAAQLDLTTAESERAGEVAGDLFSNAYGESFGEVNDALSGIIARTEELGDVSDAELSGLGANALDLARILETDVNRVVQVAGQQVEQGLAGSFEEAFDQITAASQRTMPGLQEEVLDAADEYGQFFASVGFDGERAFGLLAAASESGQYEIDKTGDAIKEFTIRATDMSEASQDAFEMIGLDAQTMANDILAGGDQAEGAFDQIVTGLLDIEDPADRANAAIALFGTPLEDLSVQEIPDFLSSLVDTESGLGDVAGATDTAGQTLNDNATTGFLTLGRTIRDDLMTHLEPLLPMLTDLAAILVPLAPVLLAVGAAVAVVAAGIAIYKAAMAVATVATWLFNAALWANPITWIVLAVIALIAIIWLLVANWDEVVAALGAVWDWLKNAATSVKDWIVDAFWTAVNAVKSAFSSATDWVTDKWGTMTDFVGDRVDDIGGFLSGMWNGIKQGLKTALNFAIGLINAAIGGINTLIDGANKVPGVNIPHVPSIPYLASGGIVTGPTLAMIGEGGDDEAVVPLPRGAKEAFSGGGGGVITLRLEGDLLRVLREDVAARGGNVQTVIGQG